MDAIPQAPWNKADKAAEQAEEMAPLGLEGQRVDLDDPRGYGNCFVDAWKWLKEKIWPTSS